MVSKFTRPQTIQMTGISSNRLSYLDRSKWAVPQKFGNFKAPKVISPWQQGLQIKTSEALPQRLQLQEVHEVGKFLNERDLKASFGLHNLGFVKSQLYFLKVLTDVIYDCAIIFRKKTNNKTATSIKLVQVEALLLN